MALPETLPFTLGVLAPGAATITTTTGTPATVISPGGATITTTPGTPSVIMNNDVSPSGATITTTTATPDVIIETDVGASRSTIATVLGTPIINPGNNSALPWMLPVDLGGGWNLASGAASITAAAGTPVVSGAGFPYQFPFVFPSDDVLIFPTPDTITTVPGIPRVTGAEPAVTPLTVTIFAEPGTPLITGPTRRTLSPGGATITTVPATPTVRTVQSVTTIFLVDGSQSVLNWNTGERDPVGDNPVLSALSALINSQTCAVQTVGWPHALPIASAINIGVNNLAVAVGNCQTNYILVGYSEGAAICSKVLQRVQAGAIEPFGLAGAVMFGNPCRQAGAIAPVQTDPGGHGVWADNRITHTPTSWWEFVLPNDIANTIPNTTFGQDVSSIFTALLARYTGGGNFIHFILDNMDNGVQINASAIGELVLLLANTKGLLPFASGMPGFAAHAAYHNTAPPGAAETCVQLAANYINQITQHGTIRATDIITPAGDTITTTGGFPFVSAVVSTGGSTITTTAGTPIVTAPQVLTPSGATITTTMGTRVQLHGLLPWQIPVTLG